MPRVHYFARHGRQQWRRSLGSLLHIYGIASKVMEHVICSNLMKHASRNSIFYALQHGFRDRRSCETQLLEFVQDIVTNMQDGAQSDVCVLDFSKAFDKVGHQHLVEKLKW